MIQSIDEVVEQLDQIVLNCIEAKSPLGYFPSLYKRITIAVRDAIERQKFEDPRPYLKTGYNFRKPLPRRLPILSKNAHDHPH